MSNQDDRLRLLSDAERSSMQEDDYDPHADNEAALAALGRGDLGAEAEGAPSPDGEPADQAVAALESREHAAAEHIQGVGSEPAKAAREALAQASGYRVDLPQDYEDQVLANKAAMTEVRRRYNDGDLDHEEMESELDRLQDQRDALRDVKTRATVSAEMRQQSERDAWTHSIRTFLDEAAKTPELGRVNYYTDHGKQADLDTFVKALGSAPGNEDKPFRWFLEEAHKRVLALHGIPIAGRRADPQRRPDASAVVTNLADVPGGAGDADPVSDEFAELDKLTGLDYERALGRLSEERRAQYLRSL